MQIKTAVKTFQLAAEKKEDYDELAEELNLDINADALQLMDEDSPKGTR